MNQFPFQNLTIHQFRGLQNLRLQNLGTINLLVGVNNSGKTSVLEAISTYCSPFNPVKLIDIAWSREIKSSRKSKLESLKWLFPQKNENLENRYRGEIHISSDGKYPISDLRIEYDEFDAIVSTSPSDFEPANEQFENDIDRGADLEFIARLGRDEVTRQINTIINSYEIYEAGISKSRRSQDIPSLAIKTITPYSHRVEQLQVEVLSRITFQGFKSKVIQL